MRATPEESGTLVGRCKSQTRARTIERGVRYLRLRRAAEGGVEVVADGGGELVARGGCSVRLHVIACTQERTPLRLEWGLCTLCSARALSQRAGVGLPWHKRRRFDGAGGGEREAAAWRAWEATCRRSRNSRS